MEKLIKIKKNSKGELEYDVTDYSKFQKSKMAAKKKEQLPRDSFVLNAF